jgi:hypothetical protein
MEATVAGATAGALLAYLLVTGARRHAARQDLRRLEAALFARRLKRVPDKGTAEQGVAYPAGERA